MVSLWLRPTYTTIDASAERLFQQAGYTATQASEWQTIASDTLSDRKFHFQAETFADDTGRPRLELQPIKTIQQPDLLLYWEEGTAVPEQVSDRSILLGPLAGSARRQFQLPATVQGQTGHLLVYSQGKQTLIAALPFAADMTQGK